MAFLSSQFFSTASAAAESSEAGKRAKEVKEAASSGFGKFLGSAKSQLESKLEGTAVGDKLKEVRLEVFQVLKPQPISRSWCDSA